MSYAPNQPLALATSILFLAPSLGHSYLMLKKRAYYVRTFDVYSRWITHRIPQMWPFVIGCWYETSGCVPKLRGRHPLNQRPADTSRGSSIQEGVHTRE